MVAHVPPSDGAVAARSKEARGLVQHKTSDLVRPCVRDLENASRPYGNVHWPCRATLYAERNL